MDVKNKNQVKPCVLWLMGLSGAGKSSIASALSQIFLKHHIPFKHLDGDDTRKTICQDLGFEDQDRLENLRRVAEVAKLFLTSGQVVICSYITPLRDHRDKIKSILGNDFHLILIDTPLAECKRRDPKGLYQKAMRGEIKNFTGISSEFENPKNPDLIIKTLEQNISEAAESIFKYYNKLK